MKLTPVFQPSVRRMAFRCAAAAWGLSLLLLVGCAGARPKHFYDADGNPVLTKRHEVYETVDYVHHRLRTVYRPASKALQAPFDVIGPTAADNPMEALRTFHCAEGALSDNQVSLVAELGRGPDYVRPAFRTAAGEKVVEWLFMRDRVVAQFVRGELVFRGELSGREKAFLQHGYPDFIMTSAESAGPARANFVYRMQGDEGMKVFAVSDDRLVYSAE